MFPVLHAFIEAQSSLKYCKKSALSKR